jgi:hypothetical protein
VMRDLVSEAEILTDVQNDWPCCREKWSTRPYFPAQLI